MIDDMPDFELFSAALRRLDKLHRSAPEGSPLAEIILAAGENVAHLVGYLSIDRQSAT